MGVPDFGGPHFLMTPGLIPRRRYPAFAGVSLPMSITILSTLFVAIQDVRKNIRYNQYFITTRLGKQSLNTMANYVMISGRLYSVFYVVSFPDSHHRVWERDYVTYRMPFSESPWHSTSTLSSRGDLESMANGGLCVALLLLAVATQATFSQCKRIVNYP